MKLIHILGTECVMSVNISLAFIVTNNKFVTIKDGEKKWQWYISKIRSQELFMFTNPYQLSNLVQDESVLANKCSVKIDIAH